jgi:sigma-B regulation protein RsbU (phosphoserine phosphatase)
LETLSTVVTQLGRVVERTRSESARFKSVIDNMPAMVYLRDTDGRYILVNRKYEEFYRVTNEEVRGKTILEIDKGPGSSLNPIENAAIDEEVKQKKESIENEAIIMRDGEEFAFTDVRFPVLDGAGKIVAISGIELDITERKRAQEKIDDAYATIRDQKEKMEKELDIGREIQMSMVPSEFPAFPNRREISIYAILQPARQVGGDLYDFYFLDDSRLCFCIGDVSDKGVPAALFMAMTKTLIKSRSVDDYSTASIVTHVNDELSKDNVSSMFVTLLLGILDVRTGNFVYTNAGHNYPYIKRVDGTLEVLKHRHGPVVGAVPGLTYKEIKLKLEVDDVIFMYTDGVTEAMNHDGELYSDDRLDKCLEMSTFQSVQNIIDEVISDVQGYAAGADQADDIAILALQFDGVSEVEELHTINIRIQNDLGEIERVNREFSEFLEGHGHPAALGYKFNVVFDEMLSNIVSYAYNDDDGHHIDVDIELSGDRVVATISDDGIPYNPFSTAMPDTDLPLEERQIGGLGVHLTRNLMASTTYQRKIDRNVTTLMQNLNDETKSHSL